jgi:hypothetical protein
MLDALAERDQRGLEGLAQRLECCLRRRKTADADVAACFLLGATGDSRYASLFLRLWTELRGSDFWTDGLRRCALISFSYAWLLQGPVQEVIEEWLAKQQKTLTKGSWFASSHTPEFLAICDILWNVQEALRPGIVTVLRAVARGARKWDAKEGIALLLLKGLEIPPDSTLDQESFDVKSAKDLMQYDKVLNFTYYWRCRAKKSGEKAGTLR